ncbi:DegT/DnrJ/EryC1/StrS family aminotransferase [Candidatus Bathyarchaeota archaeon]|nr:MAG: DegT/DnrJ/EryC1/StrS family aminotransferase [Candidatus Bathyarchaeota archaeon]
MKIPIAKPDIGKDEIQAVIETMKSGWVSQGEKVEEFEKSFAKYCGVKYGVAVNNGTAALHMALTALDVKRGDEVITTPLSCVATTNPIVYLDAKPVFVDVEATTLNINPALIVKKITDRTKAIIPVHLFGHPVDLDPLMEVAQKHDLPVIEDAAQAHGARYKGKKVGSFGCVSCFSFYVGKLITTVEGGIALTNDTELAEKMRLLRSYGMHKREKFYHPILGYNYKLSDIHAAIGLVQLRKLNNYIERKRANIEYLRSKLHHLNLKLPVELDYAFNVYYACHILVEKEKEKIVEHLEREGIETRPLLSFIPEQPPYQKYGYNIDELQVARNAHQKGFYISNSPLLTENELDLVASTIIKSIGDIQ